MTKSQMFKKAHAIAKTLEGNYSVRLGMALKQVWSDIKNLIKEVMKMISVNVYGTVLTLDLSTGELNGKTFAIKQNLKYWGCIYNPETKTWFLGSDKDAFIAKFKFESPKTQQTETVKHTNNGFCKKCGTYCYGDCQA